MANLSNSRNLATQAGSSIDVRTGDAKNATTFYAGGFVMLNTSTGYIDKAADTANFVHMGICGRQKVGDTSTLPNDVEIICGPLTLLDYPVTGASAITNQGTLVYATDDQTLTTSATANTKAFGYIAKWNSATKCDVVMLSPEASRALN
jgi:hypothetical protein